MRIINTAQSRPTDIGVSFNVNLGRYKAQTTTNGKPIYHGYFNTAEEAHEARETWIRKNPQVGFTSKHGNSHG